MSRGRTTSGLLVAACAALAMTLAPAGARASVGWEAPATVDPALASEFPSGLSCAPGGSQAFCIAMDDSGHYAKLAGSTWSGVTPAPVGIHVVSCPQESFCMGVGGSDYSTFNGTSWTTPQQVESETTVLAVSCTSSSFCVGVGITGKAWLYNGMGWGSATDVDGMNVLDAVSCASESLCVAVDEVGQAFVRGGMGWSAGSDVAGSERLYAVSCAPETTFCLAGDQNQAVEYSAGTWGMPMSDKAEGMTALACASSSFCIVTDSNGGYITYDGTTWSSRSHITTEGTARLRSLSCRSSSECVGIEEHGGAYRYNGMSWSGRVGVGGGGFTGVACPTSTFCVAVERFGSALTYDGTSWSAPVAVDAAHGLSSVSCASPSVCVAVDEHGDASTYDGMGWSAPTEAAPGSLDAVSCAPSSTSVFCMAVDNTSEDWVATYQGGGWSTTQLGDHNGLSSVSCASAAFCVIGEFATTVVRYTGMGTYSSPETAFGSGYYDYGVACASSTLCVAIGGEREASVYDGSAWHSAALADPGHYPFFVSCGSPSFCMSLDLDAGALLFDGSSWGARMETGWPSYGSTPTGVSCPSPAFCMAVAATGEADAYIGEQPPAASHPPTIAGTTREGQTLTETHGQWSGAPTSYAYQWERCGASGEGCKAIEEATGQTYVLTSADVGSTIRVTETATGPGGTGAPASSEHTALVEAKELEKPPVKEEGGSGGGGGGSTTTATTSTTGTGGGPSQPGPGATAAQLAALLRQSVTPAGKLSKLGAILAHGGFTFTFSAPEAGSLEVAWYELPPGAHLSKKAKPKLLARGSAAFAGAGAARLTVRLTATGRKLLKRAGHIRLTARGVFTPAAAVPVKVLKAFTLQR